MWMDPVIIISSSGMASLCLCSSFCGFLDCQLWLSQFFPTRVHGYFVSWAFTLELHLGPSSSQNSALLSSTMNIMKSDTSQIFFLPFVGDFFLLPEVWSILPLFKFRCLGNTSYIKYSQNHTFLGSNVFLQIAESVLFSLLNISLHCSTSISLFHLLGSRWGVSRSLNVGSSFIFILWFLTICSLLPSRIEHWVSFVTTAIQLKTTFSQCPLWLNVASKTVAEVIYITSRASLRVPSLDYIFYLSRTETWVWKWSFDHWNENFL